MSFLSCLTYTELDPLARTLVQNLPALSSSETIGVTGTYIVDNQMAKFCCFCFFFLKSIRQILSGCLWYTFLFQHLEKIRGSQVKSTFCTHGITGFSSQNPYSDSQLCNSSPRGSSTLFWLRGHQESLDIVTYIQQDIHAKMRANLLRGKTKNVFLSISSVCLFSCVQTSKSVGFHVFCAKFTQ